MGQGPGRREALFANLRRWSDEGGKAPVRDTLIAGMAKTPAQAARASEANWIIARASDRQFVVAGAQTQVEPIRLAVPFGREADGEMLSDHMGFTIEYRLGQ